MAEKIGYNLARIENEAFINGDGANRPRGILTYENGVSSETIEQISSGIDGALDGNSIITLLYSLKSEYAANVSFLMNRAITKNIRLLVDENKQYLWSPGLNGNEYNTLLGYPIIENIAMPAANKDSLSITVGDFQKAYTIVDKVGVRILRDNLTEKPFVKFYTTKRVGGELINGEALKILKLSA